MATQYMPSSMGITFIVNGNANIVRGCLSFATYRNAKVPDCMIPYLPNDPDTYRVPPELAHIMVYDKDVQALRLISSVTAKEVRNIFERDTIPENEFSILQKIAYRFVDYCAMGYVRVPHEIPEFVLDFSHGDYADDEANHNLDGTDAKLVALRRKIGDNLWSITVMLVNDRKESPVKANRCIFQAKMKVSSENNDFVFVESNPNADVTAMDSEEQSLDLLYRHKKSIRNRLGYIRRLGNRCVWSWGYMERFLTDNRDSVDEFSLPQNDLIKDEELSMKYLSDLDPSDRTTKLASMRNLVDLYKNWVDSLEKVADTLDPRYVSAAANNIRECKRAYKRMYAGIDTLAKK